MPPKRDLSEWVYVKSSPIHGKGCFAKKRIRKGQYVGFYEGAPTMRDGRYVLWVQEEDGVWRGFRGNNELRYMNHSSKPSAELNGQEVYAARLIRPDEEITFDYGEEWRDVP